MARRGTDEELIEQNAIRLSDDDDDEDGDITFVEEDAIAFEEDGPNEMERDPLDEPQECCGRRMSCTKRQIRKVMGLTLVAVAAFMFSLVTLGVKTSIHGGMKFCGVLGFRALVSWVINLAVMIGRRFPIKAMMGNKVKAPLLIILGVFGAFAQMLGFYAVSILSMADANVYMMTSPVFVFILARIWLGDPVDYVDVISAVVCIIGVMFVSKPSAIFGCTSTDDCGLTQYCSVDGSCGDCGEDIDAHPELQAIYTMDDNFTAYQMCRGVEEMVGGPFCNVTYLEAAVDEPDGGSTNCHDSCLGMTDCGFFTSGFVGTQLTCILYVAEECTATSVVPNIPEVDFTYTYDWQNQEHNPTLFHMLGEYRESDANDKVLAILMAILSAALAAVTYCVIRKIGHGIDGLVCVNYFAFISTVIAFIGGAFQGIPFPADNLVWAAVVGMGVAGFLGQYFLTVGFQLEKPGPASVIRYMDVIFVFIWDFAAFGVVPGWNNYVGATLVIGAAVGIVLNKSRKQKLGIKQAKPLLDFGDCSCCCRQKEDEPEPEPEPEPDADDDDEQSNEAEVEVDDDEVSI